VDLPINNGGSFHSYVSLPEGKFGFQQVSAAAESAETPEDPNGEAMQASPSEVRISNSVKKRLDEQRTGDVL